MTYKTKICEMCGEEYSPKAGNQKYCSKCGKINEQILNKQRCNKWYKENKQDALMKQKKYAKINKDKIRIKSQEYYLRNRDRILKRVKNYTLNNKNKIKSYKARYIKERRKKDVQFKLITWSRSQIKRCLNSNKTKRTFDILGYTPEQLKQRLEMNFKPDMTWENHGTLWHIDHRKPLCKFNFILPDGTPNYEQIRLANSLANLQPLYVTENLSKGGR